MIITLFSSFIFSLVFFVREKSSLFSIFYLTFLPFIIFSGQTPLLLTLSLLLGYLTFCLFQKPSARLLFMFIAVLAPTILFVSPRSGLDMGILNSINSQRGEHPQFQNNLIAKMIHNKSELVHSFIINFDSLLSPTAIFASGFWRKISRYYPLGYLFPWDIYFIYRYFRFKKHNLKDRSRIFFAPAILTLLILAGLIYVDQALVFGFAVIYFLALISAVGYSTISPKTRVGFAILNSAYLFYQLYTTAYFKI